MHYGEAETWRHREYDLCHKLVNEQPKGSTSRLHDNHAESEEPGRFRQEGDQSQHIADDKQGNKTKKEQLVASVCLSEVQDNYSACGYRSHLENRYPDCDHIFNKH